MDWTDAHETAFQEGADSYGKSNPRNPYSGTRAEAWAAGFHMMFMADPGDDLDEAA